MEENAKIVRLVTVQKIKEIFQAGLVEAKKSFTTPVVTTREVDIFASKNYVLD